MPGARLYKFYTPDDVALRLAAIAKERSDIAVKTYVDFSAGDERAACLIRRTIGGSDSLFYDIEPDACACETRRADFLTTDIVATERPMAMGFNPPFGYQSTLAKRFVKRAILWQPDVLIAVLPTLPSVRAIVQSAFTLVHEEQMRIPFRVPTSETRVSYNVTGIVAIWRGIINVARTVRRPAVPVCRTGVLPEHTLVARRRGGGAPFPMFIRRGHDAWASVSRCGAVRDVEMVGGVIQLDGHEYDLTYDDRPTPPAVAWFKLRIPPASLNAVVEKIRASDEIPTDVKRRTPPSLGLDVLARVIRSVIPEW